MIEIKNLTDEYRDLFSQRALEVLKFRSVFSTVAEFDNRLIPLTYLAGSVSDPQSRHLASDIVLIFNDLCEKEMVKGVLCPLSSVQLPPGNEGGLDKRNAIFLFCHVDDPHGYVKLTYPHFLTTEGEIGEYHVY